MAKSKPVNARKNSDRATPRKPAGKPVAKTARNKAATGKAVRGSLANGKAQKSSARGEAKAKTKTKAKAKTNAPAGRRTKTKRGNAPVAPVQGLTLAVTGYVAAPPPPPPPVLKTELAATRDIGRLLRYGEVFGNQRIEIQWLPSPLPVPSGALALGDASHKKALRVLDRALPSSAFRCMLSVAVGPNGPRLAAATFHCGRPPIARWSVAHFAGAKPAKTLEQAVPVVCNSGWFIVQDAKSDAAFIDTSPLPEPVYSAANMAQLRVGGGGTAVALPTKPGEYLAYWAVDENDKPICLVIDFDIFSQKDWKQK